MLLEYSDYKRGMILRNVGKRVSDNTASNPRGHYHKFGIYCVLMLKIMH
jgi:hypothetical protein